MAKDENPVKRKRTDWEAVERDYRTGKYTLRELEAKHGVKYSSIARKSKEQGWTKDLAKAIKQATHAKLTEQLVNNLVNKETHDVNTTIEAAAEVGKNVILNHRVGLKRIAEVKEKLINQIESAVIHMVDLGEVVEMVRNPDENGVDKANDLLRKVLGRSALVDDLKKLADVDEKVRKGEREAFSLNDENGKGKEEQISDEDLDARLKALLNRDELVGSR
jgi:hypothetical protein